MHRGLQKSWFILMLSVDVVTAFLPALAPFCSQPWKPAKTIWLCAIKIREMFDEILELHRKLNCTYIFTTGSGNVSGISCQQLIIR